MTRILIPCAGTSERWTKDDPKHLVLICKEPVLARQVRLIREHGKYDVRIVVDDMTDDRYKFTGTKRYKARHHPEAGDIDKVKSSRAIWDKKEDTVISWGDVWYERDDLDDILEFDTTGGWRFWGRFFGDGGELFALKFGPEHHAEIDAAIAAVEDAHAAGEMTVPDASEPSGCRDVPGGWGLYRALCGAAVNDHSKNGHVTKVDSWTEDFDQDSDWDKWCLRYGAAGAAERERRIA